MFLTAVISMIVALVAAAASIVSAVLKNGN
jgi:hypothetical protein